MLQNTELGGLSAQCRLYQCLWVPEIDAYLRNGTFHDYAERQRIVSVQVVLEPGDLYFFNTRCIHEMPGVTAPRRTGDLHWLQRRLR